MDRAECFRMLVSEFDHIWPVLIMRPLLGHFTAVDSSLTDFTKFELRTMFVFSVRVNFIWILYMCCAYTNDSLNSRSNVVSFQLNQNENNETYEGILQTDNGEIGTINLLLKLLPDYTLIRSEMSSSDGGFLYQGHVTHTMNGTNQIDLDSPVRLRYCDGELQGFFILRGKTFNIDYDQDKRKAILYAPENMTESRQGDNERCGVKETFTDQGDRFLRIPSTGPLGEKQEKPERWYKIQVTVNHEFGHYKNIDRNRTNQEVLLFIFQFRPLALLFGHFPGVL